MTSKYNRYYTKDEDDIIRRMYLNVPYSDIGKMINRSPESIKDRVRKLGLTRKHKVKQWTQDEIRYIKHNYHKDPYIHIKLNRSKQSVALKAHQLGIRAHGRGLSKANQDFFKRFSHDMAYIIGVIASDGNVFKKKKTIGAVLNITQKDAFDWLNNIKNKIDPHDSISIHIDSNGNYYFDVRSDEMWKDLKKLGITPKKSKTIGRVKIPAEYFASFLLGVVDGDGGFYIPDDLNTNTKTINSLVITSGSWNFLNWIQSKLSKYLGIPRRKISRITKVKKDGTVSKVYRLKYNGPLCTEVAYWMYTNANTNLMLPRKYELYKRMMSSDVVKRRYEKSTHPRHNTLPKPVFNC